MQKYCSNCGKELKEGADICLNCGVLINKQPNHFYSKQQKNKIPGNGMSIAGMVLGIIAAVWTFFELIAVGGIPESLSNIAYSTNYYVSLSYLYFWFGFGYTLFSLIPSIVGLPFSIVGLIKHKSGKNISGTILNIVSLLVSIIMIIYILSFA